MKNKYRHGKLVTGLTMGLVAVSLVTVGFSAWVIKGQLAEQQIDNITVNVAEVQDKRVTLALGGTNGVVEGVVKFDAPAEGGSGTIQGSAGAEDMDFKIQFVATVEDPNYFQGITVKMAETGNHIADFVSKDYIIAPFTNADTKLVDSTWLQGLQEGANAPHVVKYGKEANSTATTGDLANAATASVAINKSGTTYTFDVTYTFAWGEVFNYKNPINSTSEAAISGIKYMTGKTPKFNLTIAHNPDVTVTVPTGK